MTVLFVLLLAGVLTGCNKNINLNLDGYTAVVYDCMGGNIDRLPTRTLFAKPGSLLVEPQGTSGLVSPKKEGYALIGWYTAHGEGTYSESSTGEYVNYFNFTLDEEKKADYVGYPYYYESSLGEYVAVQGATAEDITYEVYDNTKEEHTGLKRYDMVMRYELFDEEEPKHEKLSRYTATAAYVYYNANNPDHVSLTRYDASFTWNENDKWDFAADKVSNENFTLYARWVRNLKITLDFNDGLGNERVYENGVLDVSIERGEKIAERRVIPNKKAGYTFTYWYKDPECTERWDFANDVFPTDETITEIRLYAGYVEGAYVRIMNADEFGKIKDYSAKYLLLADIDFGKIMQTFSKASIRDEATMSGGVFTGELNGYGHTISNIRINAYHIGKELLKETQYFGFFGITENANIHDINLQGEIRVNADSTKDMYIGAVAGMDKGGSTFKNIDVDFTTTMFNGTSATSDIWFGELSGAKTPTTTIINCVTPGNLIANISTSGTLVENKNN